MVTYRSDYRLSLEAEADALTRALAGLDAQSLIDRAVNELAPGRICAVSSFGAESAVILHMLSVVAPDTPVLFLDTGKLFDETLAYRDELAAHLGLTRLVTLHPAPGHLQADDPSGTLHQRNTDLCCHVRKTLPLIKGLRPYEVWISGRKRHHGGDRAALPLVEIQDGRLKINPLYDWNREAIEAYFQRHDLPAHPLVEEGYPSLGCAPCTQPVTRPGDDPRAGRWAGEEKTECGIHLTADGTFTRIAR